MLRKLKLPILCLGFFILLIVIWKIFKLPPDAVLIEMIRGYFIKYGLITVFLASLIEGMLLVGWYLPGGLVIFLGVILSAGDPYRAILSVTFTILGLFIAYSFNYFLGLYGWYKLLVKFGLSKSLEDAQQQFQKHGYKAIYFSFWQPNFAALISTAAGILKTPFRKFLLTSAVATIVWSSFWGIIAYTFGQKVLDYLGIVFLVVMIGWIGIITINHFRSQNKTTVSF